MMKDINQSTTLKGALSGGVMALLIFALVLTGCDGAGTTGPQLEEPETEDVPNLDIVSLLSVSMDSTQIPEALGINSYGLRLQITNNNSTFAGRGRVSADGATIASLDISGGRYDYPAVTMESVEAWEYNEAYDKSLFVTFSLDGTILEYGEHELLDGLFIKELEAVITGDGHWLDGDTLLFRNRSVE